MDKSLVQTALIEVLKNIQTLSELECPAIHGTTKPIEELPQFDSKIWPVAIGMLSEKLGVEIAPDVNVFRKDDSIAALTVDEIVSKVSALIESQSLVESKQVVAQ